MKIINAFWEKRNLGLDVIEITIDNNDLKNFDNIEKKLRDDFTDKYVVIKMPVGNLTVLHKLQDLGFYFMESLFTLEKNIETYSIPEKFQSLNNLTDAVIIPPDQFDSVIEKIPCGMYSTDRIYLDPCLDYKMSRTRYVNWIKDLQQQENTIMYETVLKSTSEPVGYGVCIYNKEIKEMYSLLTGIYPASQGKGLGALVIHSPVLIAQKKKCKIVKTAISSNNIKVFKKHMPFAFDITCQQYVLRRFPAEGITNE